MKSFDMASADIQNIRAAMNGRIGEIITAVIGNDALQTIFEQPENNEKYIELNKQGKPSGIIALDLGIIDVETKNALLVAQAAERTTLNAEHAMEIANGAAPRDEWNLSPKDDVFKFVGSDRDPKILQEAQATWQLSQIVLRASFDDKKEAMGEDSTLLKSDPEYPNILLKAAANYYAAASEILKNKGFEDAATKLIAVASSITPENAATIALKPHDIAQQLTNHERGFNEMLMSTGNENMIDNEGVLLGEKLSRLTEGQTSSSPAPGDKFDKNM